MYILYNLWHTYPPPSILKAESTLTLVSSSSAGLSYFCASWSIFSASALGSGVTPSHKPSLEARKLTPESQSIGSSVSCYGRNKARRLQWSLGDILLIRQIFLENKAGKGLLVNLHLKGLIIGSVIGLMSILGAYYNTARYNSALPSSEHQKPFNHAATVYIVRWKARSIVGGLRPRASKIPFGSKIWHAFFRTEGEVKSFDAFSLPFHWWRAYHVTCK